MEVEAEAVGAEEEVTVEEVVSTHVSSVEGHLFLLSSWVRAD